MKVRIYRGLPGAGKDWHIRENYPDALICSADDYHKRVEHGQLIYDFKPENAAGAHDACFRKYVNAVIGHGFFQQPEVLVVNNTNISAWEFAPYYRLAEVYGHEVEIIYLDCSLATAIGRNVHNVPLATLQKMKDRLEDCHRVSTFPHWWKMTTLEVFTEFDFQEKQPPRDEVLGGEG